MRDVMSNVRCCRENMEKGAGTERRNQIMYFLRAETKVLS